MNLLSIEAHCLELVEYFGALSDFQGYDGTEQVSSWLTLSSGLKGVEYDITDYDTGAGVCGLADIWAERQAKLQKELVKLIGQFSFCWAALETMIDLLLPESSSKKKGKISKLCEFLNTHYIKYEIIYGYEESVQLLDKYVNRSMPGNKLRNVNKPSSSIGKPGVGIFRVYHLRNLLAHGAFDIPVHNEESEIPEIKLLEVSIRIVLLTIQMTAIAKYGEELVEVYWKDHLIEAVNTYSFLSCIHTDTVTYLHEDSEQLKQI